MMSGDLKQVPKKKKKFGMSLNVIIIQVSFSLHIAKHDL